MAVTKSHIKATSKYEREAYFKTLVRFKKDDEEKIRKSANGNLNGFIVECVLNAINGNAKPDYAAYDEQKSHASLQALIDAKRKEYEENKEKVDPEEIRRLTIARASDINEGLGERKKKTEDGDF